MVSSTVKDATFVVMELKHAESPLCTFAPCQTIIQQCNTHTHTHKTRFFFPLLCQYQCQLRDFSRAQASHYPAALWWESIHRKCTLLFHAWRPCEENINAMTHSPSEALYTQPHTFRQIHCGSAYKGRSSFFFHLIILHIERLPVTLHHELQDHSTMEK